jgi:hypothetical protein
MASVVGSPRPTAHFAVDRLGMPLGRIRHLTLGGEWAVVEAGAVFHRSSLVPLDGCRLADSKLVVPWMASTVWAAPRTRIRPDRDISGDLRVQLLHHYGL